MLHCCGGDIVWNMVKLWRRVHSLWFATCLTVSRHPRASVVVGLILLVIANSAWKAITAPVLTPEQVMAQQEQERHADAQREQFDQQQAVRASAASKYKQQMCHMKDVCIKNGETRQQCATAGSYRTCLQIKMGDDASLVGLCTNDGAIAGASDTIPNAVECVLARVGIY